MSAGNHIRTYSLFSKSPLSMTVGSSSFAAVARWIGGDSEMIALSSTLGNGKHATGLRFLTVTEGTGYEIMSVGRRNGSYSPKPTLVRNTARPGSMGPELRTDQ